VLETATNVIGLGSELDYYFGLYLVEDETGKVIVRKLQDFESPYVSLGRAEKGHIVQLRKAYVARLLISSFPSIVIVTRLCNVFSHPCDVECRGRGHCSPCCSVGSLPQAPPADISSRGLARGRPFAIVLICVLCCLRNNPYVRRYWDIRIDSILQKNPIALNLLYIETINEIKKGSIMVEEDAADELASFRSKKERKAFLELASTLKGCVIFPHHGLHKCGVRMFCLCLMNCGGVCLCVRACAWACVVADVCLLTSQRY
jgi:hypothetical protein